jgi:hypothetical protein
MTHLRRLSIVALAAALLVAPGGASAQTPTLDQSQSLLNGVRVVFPPLEYGQTFRAGLSGGLPLVELAVNRQPDDPGPLLVELQSTSAGEPTGQVLATTSVPADMVPSNTEPEFVQFELQPVVPITAGMLYALTLQAPDSTTGPSYGWGGDPSGDPYPAGEAWAFGPQEGWLEIGGDFAFRTYVNQAGVGAPGAPPGLAQRIAELKALLERRACPRPDRSPTEIARPCARRAPSWQHQPREPVAASIRQPRRRPTGQEADGRAGAAAIYGHPRSSGQPCLETT